MTPRQLQIRLFGHFEMGPARDGAAPPTALSHAAQDLLALVLLAPRGSVSREYAADALWPDASPDGSRKAIRQTLWQIHQVTDPGWPDDHRLISSDGSMLWINPGRPLWVDATWFATEANRALSTDDGRVEDLDVEAAAALCEVCRGPLLAACYHNWCLVERSHLEDLQIGLLDRLSLGFERRGEIHRAVSWAHRLLEVEPAHERTHRRLMLLYLRADDRTRALRQYQRCRWVLERELGIQPSPRTQALADAICNGRDLGTGYSVGRAVDQLRAEVEAELAAIQNSLEALATQIRDATA